MAVNGVTMAGKHSYNVWGLFFRQAPEISPPEPKTHYVDIPGKDGVLDLTETLTGSVRYRNRKMTLVFVSPASRTAWRATYLDILATLHGKLVPIVFDDDPQYMYTGRVTVGAPQWQSRCVTLRMEIDANPYKSDMSGGGTQL